MKKTIVSLSLMLAVGFTAFAADEPIVNEKIRASFKKEFAAAQLITWTVTGDYLKATFLLGSHRAEAYFSEDGKLEGCARNLFYDQLPLVVMTSIDSRYNGAVILDVREVVNDDGTVYRLTLEFNGKKYRIKVNTGGSIIESERLKK